jgi:Family of unknown function (DUF5670)
MCLDYFIASPISALAIEGRKTHARKNASYKAAILGIGTVEREPRMGSERRKAMLWTIFVILLVLWLLGLVTSYTMGGFIHILLVLAVVVLVIRLVQGRSVV